MWGGWAEPDSGAQGGKAGTETQLSRKPPSPGKAGSPGCTPCPVHLLSILQPSRFSKPQSELVSPSKERIGRGAGPALEPRARAQVGERAEDGSITPSKAGWKAVEKQKAPQLLSLSQQGGREEQGKGNP